MLIYENNNKLNINFDNKVSENPDLQINKEDGKTEVLIDGQSISGGTGGGVLVVNVSLQEEGNRQILIFDKTAKEVFDAISIKGVIVKCQDDTGIQNYNIIKSINDNEGGYLFIIWSDGVDFEFYAENENDYQTAQAK